MNSNTISELRQWHGGIGPSKATTYQGGGTNELGKKDLIDITMVIAERSDNCWCHDQRWEFAFASSMGHGPSWRTHNLGDFKNKYKFITYICYILCNR